MSHSITDPAGETCEHGVRWAVDCAQCGEFEEMRSFHGCSLKTNPIMVVSTRSTTMIGFN
jgi:hypothetical protein